MSTSVSSHTVRLGLALSLALAAPAIATAQQGAGPTTWRGEVIDATTGTVLRRARIDVTRDERTLASTMTDDQGLFLVPAAPPASVRVSKAGYAAAAIPLTNPSGLLRIALAPGAAVSGRVTDSSGAPMQGGTVVARPVGRVQARPLPRQMSAAVNDYGEFRLGGLASGRYALAAVPVGVAERGAEATIEISVNAGDDVSVDLVSAATVERCALSIVRDAPSDKTSGAVRGSVRSTSGQPLACASVRIVSSASVAPVYTDRQGRYVIDRIAPGSVRLEARKAAYATRQYGQDDAQNRPRPVTVRAGVVTGDVDFILPREGSISGTVVDEHGEPVEGISVGAVTLQRLRGRLSLSSPARSTATDDRGRYHTSALPAGTYAVVAQPGSPTPSLSFEGRAYPPTFFPGGNDFSSATKVMVAGGRDVSGIDIVLSPSPSTTVSGTAFDVSGRPLAGEAVIAPGAGSRSAFAALTTATDASGRFTFSNIVPGDYVVQAHSEPRGQPQWGMQNVRVTEETVAPIVITTGLPTTVVGRVTAEGRSDVANLGLRVGVAPTDRDAIPIPATALGRATLSNPETVSVQQGRFRLPNVMGTNRILLTASRCDTCYLKATYVNGADVTDTPYDFGVKGGVFEGVTLVVSDAGGAVELRARDERNQTVTEFTAVVFSTDRSLWYPGSPHVSARQATDGTVRCTGLPPGDYYAIAAAGVDPIGIVDAEDPAVLEGLVIGAARVTVTAGARPSATLRLTTR